MKTKLITGLAALTLVLAAGCNRGQTRGNADANENRAATPAEGGATSTTGSAGDARNFGDTRTKTQSDGASPSASPTGVSKDASSDSTPHPVPNTPPPEKTK